MEKENVSKQKQLSCMLSLPKKEKKIFILVPREWLGRNVSRQGSMGWMGIG
jgi:hypothetical protein